MVMNGELLFTATNSGRLLLLSPWKLPRLPNEKVVNNIVIRNYNYDQSKDQGSEVN